MKGEYLKKVSRYRRFAAKAAINAFPVEYVLIITTTLDDTLDDKPMRIML